MRDRLGVLGLVGEASRNQQLLQLGLVQYGHSAPSDAPCSLGSTDCSVGYRTQEAVGCRGCQCKAGQPSPGRDAGRQGAYAGRVSCSALSRRSAERLSATKICSVRWPNTAACSLRNSSLMNPLSCGNALGPLHSCTAHMRGCVSARACVSQCACVRACVWVCVCARACVCALRVRML